MEENYYPDYYRLENEHWWFVGRRRIIIDMLARRLGKITGPKRIIDVGCGTGIMLGYLGKFGDVTGLDYSPIALDYCRQRGFTDLREGDICSLLNTEGKYDVVTAFDILEHVDDDGAALRAVADILHPGGLLMFTVPAHPWLWSHHDLINQHKRRYRRADIAAAVARAGLEIERLTYYNCLLFPLLAGTRLFQKIMARELVARHDLAVPPGWLNVLLTGIFASERQLLRLTNLPIGVSLLCFAKKR